SMTELLMFNWLFGRKPTPPQTASPMPVDTAGTQSPPAAPQTVRLAPFKTDCVDTEAVWRRIGDNAWETLRNRIPGGLSHASLSRFNELPYYWSIVREFAESKDLVLVGVTPQFQPVFVDRALFASHAYILGGTGRFKTTAALAPLLVQLNGH